METVARQDKVELSLLSLETADGVSLNEEVGKAFARIEADMQAHAEANHGEPPLKPYKVGISLEIMATGPYGRAINWSIQVSPPKSGQRTQYATVRDGVVVVDRPAKQFTIHDMMEGDNG